MRRTRWLVCVVVVLVSVLLAAGCSSSNSDKSSSKARTVTNTSLVADQGPEPGAQRLHFEFGPLTVNAGQNNISTSIAGIPKPNFDGWIVRMTPNLRLADGSVPPVDVIHLHHGVWLNLSGHDATSRLPERFFAAGEEKTIMVLPPGYGYQYKASDHWVINYMLHNLTSKPDKVWITYDIDIIPNTAPEAAHIIPAHPVWMDVENGSVYPVFDVPRGGGHNGAYTFPDDATDPYHGRRVRNQWTVPNDGVLLATAGHLHPGGLHDDLWLQRNGAAAPKGHDKPGHSDTAHLFSSIAHYYEPAGPVSWDVSMTGTPSDWRVQVHKGDVLSTTTTYDSTRASWYESMGIMVVWMADGNGGVDPFQKPVDASGQITHGHLQENDNHGGAPAPNDFVDASKLPSQPPVNQIVIDNFVYSRGDLTVADSVPTVVQGQSITFVNKDATLPTPIWHTITACESPCDRSTGIAYPLANGTPKFDSGELGYGGPPTADTNAWSTPTDLPPGTYTYYCRIHPGMRGAFRVVPKPS